MIQSVQELPIILTSNSSALSLSNDDVRSRRANCCGWLQHAENTPIYKILDGGDYEVSFNANVSSATAGTVALGLYQDGVLVQGTTVIAEVVTANVGHIPNIKTKVGFSFNKPLIRRSPKTFFFSSILVTSLQ